MSTVSKSFTAAGQVSDLLSIAAGQSVNIAITGTFVATVVLEQTDSPAAYFVTARSYTVPVTENVRNDTSGALWYRFRCAAFTSGTAVTTISDAADIAYEVKDDAGNTLIAITDGITSGTGPPASGTISAASVITPEVGSNIGSNSVKFVGGAVEIRAGGSLIADFAIPYLRFQGGVGSGLIWGSLGGFFLTAASVFQMQNAAFSAGIRFQLGIPTIASGFGGSPAIGTGSCDCTGEINVGTGGVATSGVIQFASTWTRAPFAIVQNRTTGALCRATCTTTQMTITSTAAWAANDVIVWHCYGAMS